jgi:hypothetical protein
LENKHRCPRGSRPSHLDEKKEDEIQFEKLMWTRGNGSDLIQSPSLHIRFNFSILDENHNVHPSKKYLFPLVFQIPVVIKTPLGFYYLPIINT